MAILPSVYMLQVYTIFKPNHLLSKNNLLLLSHAFQEYDGFMKNIEYIQPQIIKQGTTYV